MDDKTQEKLYLVRLGTFQSWLALWCEADCLTNPEKRRLMLNARRDYQDALLNYASASRYNAPRTA